MILKSVYSSHVSEIGYDPDQQALHVVFKNGKHAVYRDVPPEVADSVTSAPSIGTAINNSIRDQYEFAYV